MAENTKEFEVKRYLIKLISDKYKMLRSLIYKAFGQSGYATAYTDIANGFMGGTYTNERRQINRHKQQYVAKNYADYNYFDLQTLYSYLQYLTMLINKIEDYSFRNGRYVVDDRVFRTALNDTLRFMNGNQEKPASGYYKGYVVLSKKEGSEELNPVKTSNDKVDMAKSREYQEYIKDYFEKKYAKKNALYEQLTIGSKYNPPATTPYGEGDDKEEFLVTPEDCTAQSFEIIPYKYRNKKFNLFISKEEKFFTASGYAVYRIKAESRFGALWRTVDIDDNIYTGPLYNEDFEEVLDADESGESFYPSQELLRMFAPKPKKEEKVERKRLDELTMDYDD